VGGIGFGAGLFALAAFVPGHRVLRPGRALAVGAAIVIAELATIVAVADLCCSSRPDMSMAATVRSPLTQPDPAANAGMLVLELAITAIYGLATLGFLRRFKRRRDDFSGWLAIAAILAAAGSVNYLLLPASYFSYFSLGDVFRLCFLVALLIGSAREISSHWRTLSADSVLEERQRIAHDLHDGLAQELAYLIRNLESLNGSVDGETKARLRAAAERAQAEARVAISTFGAPGKKTVNVAIGQAVGEVAARDHVKVELDIVPGIRLPAARAEALTRIACEAVGNAARHSGAEQVRLSLCRCGTRVRLSVSDNGSGFDPGVPSGRFGLTCMRDRARSVGGDLRISSEPGSGTKVEATL
jgi:signal transduction histidine kinase